MSFQTGLRCGLSWLDRKGNMKLADYLVDKLGFKWASFVIGWIIGLVLMLVLYCMPGTPFEWCLGTSMGGAVAWWMGTLGMNWLEGNRL